MLTLGIIQERMGKLDNWSLERDSIVKDFEFKDFREALDFVNKIGEIAEKQEHHPDIVISYNKVKVSLTTHSENGLTSRDFKVAEDIDKMGK